MPGDQTFEQQLQSHTGGLVRVDDEALDDPGLRGHIGLLVSARLLYSHGPALVALLADGIVHTFYAYPGELEFIGSDDA